MIKVLNFLLATLLCLQAWAGPKPVTVTLTYDIVGVRKAMCSGVAIGPRLLLSCDHAVRDDRSSLGRVITTDRKYDRTLILLDDPVDVWSPVRETPLEQGEQVYFNGGHAVLEPAGLRVKSGQIIEGMSGGPIWDGEGRVVSVISEYEIGAKILFGYEGLAPWVAANCGPACAAGPGKAPAPPEYTPAQQDPVAALQAAIAALKAPAGKAPGGSQDALPPAPPAPSPAGPPNAPQGQPQAPAKPTVQRTLLYFGAAWCGGCRTAGPAFEKFAAAHPELECRKLDVDSKEGQALGYKLKVGTVPQYVLVGEGDKVLGRKVGRQSDDALLRMLTDAPEPEAPEQAEPADGKMNPHVRVLHGNGGGSGVIIGRRGDEWLVLTAQHVKASVVEIGGIGGERRPVRLIKKGDAGRVSTDLKLLAIPAKSEDITPVPIADAQPGKGGKVTTHGYPALKKYDPKESYVVVDLKGSDTINGYFVGGVSGGSVEDETGAIVGIFSTSNRRDEAHVADAGAIREFVESALLGEGYCGVDDDEANAPGTGDATLENADPENPPPGYHTHRCDNCETMWVHNPNKGAVSHKCPKCGRTQTLIYRSSRQGSRAA